MQIGIFFSNVRYTLLKIMQKWLEFRCSAKWKIQSGFSPVTRYAPKPILFIIICFASFLNLTSHVICGFYDNQNWNCSLVLNSDGNSLCAVDYDLYESTDTYFYAKFESRLCEQWLITNLIHQC